MRCQFDNNDKYLVKGKAIIIDPILKYEIICDIEIEELGDENENFISLEYKKNSEFIIIDEHEHGHLYKIKDAINKYI